MQYYQLSFSPVTSEQSSILIAELSEIGFEGFEEIEDRLHAFIGMDDFNEALVNVIATTYQTPYTISHIEETNWNKVWESNFSPVVVDDFVGIRADFHEPITSVEKEIVITPKMSFGTGHHATTYMMIQQMSELDFKNKRVLDFGTGTGILAILAEQLGAKEIVAIDYDEWSINNAKENIENNACTRIELRKQDNPEAKGENFDIILANINKHIILENLKTLNALLGENGKLLLSGLLHEDREDIMKIANANGLIPGAEDLRHNWLVLSYSKR